MTCQSDTGECSGIINGFWCDRRYPWAITSDEDMWCEYINYNDKDNKDNNDNKDNKDN